MRIFIAEIIKNLKKGSFISNLTVVIFEVGLTSWIVDLVPVSNDIGKLILAATHDYKKNTVDGYYKKILEESCEAVSGLPMEIEIIVREMNPENKINEVDNSETEDNYTFENFIVGESNKMAHASAFAVAKKPIKNNYNPLVIYGSSGVGKTHLMSAIKNSINKIKFGNQVLTPELFKTNNYSAE